MLNSAVPTLVATATVAASIAPGQPRTPNYHDFQFPSVSPAGVTCTDTSTGRYFGVAQEFIELG